MTVKTAAILAGIATALALTAGCSTGPAAEGANPTTSASSATARALPDDEVVPARGESLYDLQEQAYKDVTCEMLDDGLSLDSIMLGTVMVTDKPFTDERAGELIVDAIMQDCPRHTDVLLDLIESEGY